MDKRGTIRKHGPTGGYIVVSTGAYASVQTVCHGVGTFNMLLHGTFGTLFRTRRQARRAIESCGNPVPFKIVRVAYLSER